MLERPAILGVTQIAPTARPVSVKASLAQLGLNSGNMMFTEALARVLSNTKAVSFHLKAEDLEGRDAIVFAAANWINPHNDFGEIADRLEKSDLPVFAIGVGAQASLKKEIPRISEGTLRFLKLVSERSTSISTRGTFSSEVLEHYGIKNSVPTGCPSLLLTGKGGVQYTQEASMHAVTLHGTRHAFHAADSLQDIFYKEAFAKGFDILLQSETADIIVAMQDLKIEEDMSKAKEFVRDAYGAASTEEAVFYLLAHGKYFTDYQTWVAYMKTRSFCLGTRIHGTIASLIAGTPALLMAHDSRTLELAETMGVPHIATDSMESQNSLDVERYIESFHEQAESSVHGGYVKTFEEYFAANNLAVNI